MYTGGRKRRKHTRFQMTDNEIELWLSILWLCRHHLQTIGERQGCTRDTRSVFVAVCLRYVTRYLSRVIVTHQLSFSAPSPLYIPPRYSNKFLNP